METICKDRKGTEITVMILCIYVSYAQPATFHLLSDTQPVSEQHQASFNATSPPPLQPIHPMCQMMANSHDVMQCEISFLASLAQLSWLCPIPSSSCTSLVGTTQEAETFLAPHSIAQQQLKDQYVIDTVLKPRCSIMPEENQLCPS